MLTGVSPPPLWLPKNAIDPDLVIHPHRIAQWSIGGQALSNSFSISVLRISYHTKNISPELISNQNNRRFSPFGPSRSILSMAYAACFTAPMLRISIALPLATYPLAYSFRREVWNCASAITLPLFSLFSSGNSLIRRRYGPCPTFTLP